jgi:hypothetical protein
MPALTFIADDESECVEDVHLIPALVALPFALLLSAWARLTQRPDHPGRDSDRQRGGTHSHRRGVNP